MKPGEVIHLSDGTYLHFSGYNWELRSDHPETPNSTVKIEVKGMEQLIREVFKALPSLQERLL